MTNNMKKGWKLEKDSKNVLGHLGFSNLITTKISNDGGADIKGEYLNGTYTIQCKNHAKPVGRAAVQEVVASKAHYCASRCMVVSTSGFTPQAVETAYKNYCLLFTLSELDAALQQGKQFDELISHYTFPNNYSGVASLDLIQLYEMKKMEISRVPRLCDFDPHTYMRINKFGGIKKLVAIMGDTPHNSKPSKKAMHREYERMSDYLQRKPILNDMADARIAHHWFQEYPFSRLQLECGHTPNVARNLTKDDLLMEYERLNKKLCRVPTAEDIENHGLLKITTYRSVFGTLDEFLLEACVSKRHFFKNVNRTDSELMLQYTLSNILLKVYQDDHAFEANYEHIARLRIDGKPITSPGSLSKRFGGKWGGFKDALQKSSASVTLVEDICDAIRKFQMDYEMAH